MIAMILKDWNDGGWAAWVGLAAAGWGLGMGRDMRFGVM